MQRLETETKKPRCGNLLENAYAGSFLD